MLKLLRRLRLVMRNRKRIEELLDESERLFLDVARRTEQRNKIWQKGNILAIEGHDWASRLHHKTALGLDSYILANIKKIDDLLVAVKSITEEIVNG